VRKPRATVTVRFPEAEGREDARMTLYQGANLRRAMLSSGVALNDPLARRFDAGASQSLDSVGRLMFPVQCMGWLWESVRKGFSFG